MNALKQNIRLAVEDYLKAWEIFVDVHSLGELAGRPTAIGWKVADLTQHFDDSLLQGRTLQSFILTL